MGRLRGIVRRLVGKKGYTLQQDLTGLTVVIKRAVVLYIFSENFGVRISAKNGPIYAMIKTGRKCDKGSVLNIIGEIESTFPYLVLRAFNIDYVGQVKVGDVKEYGKA